MDEQAAFEGLKAAFTAAPVLVMPNMEVAFQVETDASDFALGAVLSQQAGDGDWRPMAFFSKAMQLVERNYDVHDKELLSVVRAFEVWRPYLKGNPHTIEVFSDHQNLKYFMTAQDFNRCQACWSLFLNCFIFCIRHWPGCLSAGPDRLSHHPDHEVPQVGQDNVGQTLLGNEQVAKRAVVVTVGMCEDSKVTRRVAAMQKIVANGNILECIRVAAPKDPKLTPLWNLQDAPALIKSRLREFTVDGGLVRFCGLIYVPDDNEVKRMILQLYHDSIPAGHPGQANTLVLVARNYYWPRMSEFVC